MAKAYRQLPIDTEVHDALAALRDNVSELVFGVPSRIGMGSMVRILLAHAREHPPEVDWLKAQAEAVPKRGRPRRTVPVTKIDEWGKPVVVPPPRQ